MGMVKPGQTTGTFGRGMRLGKLGLSLTGSYLGYQMQNLFLGEDARRKNKVKFERKSSQRVREELGRLKGPMMKLGQLLSLQSQMLPEHALRELTALQMRAPAMHPTLARAQFKRSCGKYPEEVFREFEDQPLAAASLGQVHRAMSRAGERLAVKIQYPAIRRAIENDFKLLRSATLPSRLTGHVPVSILAEVQRGFLEEADYVKEAQNIIFFQKGLREFSWLTIPTVDQGLSTGQVLTMSFVEGWVTGDFLAANPPQAVRDLIGSRLFELYHFQLQCLKTLHADHHPGNFLFQKDGRIGVVDFGCVKRTTIDFAGLCRSCMRRSWSESKAEAERVCRVIWPGVPFSRSSKMLGSLEELVDVLFPEAAHMVDFGKPMVLKALGQSLGKALKHKLNNPEFAFVSRTELGLYSLLHELKARVNTREICEKVFRRTAQGRS
jgi:predicted unusual protein kinase regulating ubiquinone biosynthesis (AarF/ABC1/UbiB family)